MPMGRFTRIRRIRRGARRLSLTIKELEKKGGEGGKEKWAIDFWTKSSVMRALKATKAIFAWIDVNRCSEIFFLITWSPRTTYYSLPLYIFIHSSFFSHCSKTNRPSGMEWKMEISVFLFFLFLISMSVCLLTYYLPSSLFWRY